MNTSADRIPVIVGVGQINDRPDDPQKGLDSLGLMEMALRNAESDAGGNWLRSIDSLSVVDQISWPDITEPHDKLAAKLGASPGICEKSDYASGDSPVMFLNMAANRIAAGEIETAAITGGEGLRTAAKLAALKAGTSASDQNAMRRVASNRTKSYRQIHHLVTPIDVYPLYENATRAAWGMSFDEAQAESAQIWSKFSDVANANPNAWIHNPASPEKIQTVTADNRMLAYPYSKLMVANSSVNQGAGFIVTSLAKARAMGVSEDKLIFVRRGAASHESNDFLKRDGYAHSYGMETSLKKALELNNISIEQVDHVELYSCFPCVPKMARRIIDWPLDRPATVFGGLTFGGGPIGNYMSHAIASMVDTLRDSGTNGLLFANGGYANHNHTILLSREPGPQGKLPHSFDFQAEADAARPAAPELIKNHEGPARIESYTAFYERSGEVSFGTIVALTDDNKRTLARVPKTDTDGIARLLDGANEPIGLRGKIAKGAEDIATWRF